MENIDYEVYEVVDEDPNFVASMVVVPVFGIRI